MHWDNFAADAPANDGISHVASRTTRVHFQAASAIRQRLVPAILGRFELVAGYLVAGDDLPAGADMQRYPAKVNDVEWRGGEYPFDPTL